VVSVSANTTSGKCCVSIFINLFDKHEQVCPCDAIVKSITRVEGSALPAFLDASKKNAYVETIFLLLDSLLPESDLNVRQIKVRQMVGFFVRRIINDLKPDQKVVAKENLGRIIFGSRCEIEFDTSIFKLSENIRPGKRVNAGDDTIATRI